MCSFERCCRTFLDSCLILVHCRWNLWWMLPKNCSFNQENDDTPIHSWTLGRLALKQTQIYAKSMVTHLETEKDGEHIDKRLFSMGNIKTCSSFRRRATHLTRTWGNFSQPRSKKTFAPGMFDVMKMMVRIGKIIIIIIISIIIIIVIIIVIIIPKMAVWQQLLSSQWHQTWG